MRQLKDTQAPLPSTTRNSPETAFQSFGSEDDRVRQLQQECELLGQEREAFRRPVLELQTVNTKLNTDLEQASLAIDICLPCVKSPPGAPVTLDKSMLALVRSVGKRSVRHPQLSTPPLLTLPRGPLPLLRLRLLEDHPSGHLPRVSPPFPGRHNQLQLVWLPHRVKSPTGKRRWTPCPRRGQSPISKGRHGVEEQVSPIAPRTHLKPKQRRGMREQASCPTEDPTRLALQGQGLTVDPSFQSRCGLSRKQRKKTGIVLP